MTDFEEKLRAVEATSDRLFELSLELIAVVGHDRKLRRVNKAWKRILGYTESELLGRDYFELLHPDDNEATRTEAERGRTGAPMDGLVNRARCKDGSYRWISWNAMALPEERLTYAIGRDITETRHAQEALRRSQESLAEAQRLAKLGSWEADLIARTVEWSDECGRLYGAPDTPPDRRFELYVASVPQDELGRVIDQFRTAIRSRQPIDVMHRLVNPGGAVRVVQQLGVVRYDTHGRPTAITGTTQDVTERQAMQARLALADRMASLGTLAAGVAHEINNPLAYVTANLSFASETLAQDGAPSPEVVTELRDAVEEAKEGCERIRLIVKDLKMFSRPDERARGPVDVRRAIESALTMAGNEIRHRARLTRDLLDVPKVEGNEARLGQVFLNLLVNAAHAIPEGAAPSNEIRVSTRQRDGWVVVEVRDSGSGIPADVLPRIFDPFFTTKPIGVGTGLGLAVCHGIVASLGGSIEVESEPGQGTTFRVVLQPVRGELVVAAPEPAPRGHKRGRVVIIDDEPLVVSAIRRELSSEHDVEAFSSAQAALTRLRQDAVDAVLCDLTMPDMSGMDLYEQIRAHRPEILPRLAFVTGGALTEVAQRFLDQLGNRHLEKPFENQALRALVRRLVEA